MFSATKNPYAEPIAKATDEKQTSEDWGSLLTIWEKVRASARFIVLASARTGQLRGRDGVHNAVISSLSPSEKNRSARNCVAAIVQRLQHRNANVQLFSLTLANALVQNCGKPLHREIAGKTFTDALKRLVTDRNTHEKVKQRIASLIKEWTKQFERDTTLGIMGETYDFLQAKGIRFDEPREEGPPPVPDSVLKREEEDLQRAIAESEREVQHRTNGPSGYAAPNGFPTSSSQKPLPAVQQHFISNGPYPSLQRHAEAPVQSAPSPQPSSSAQEQAPSSRPTRVRALYDFDPDPDQPGELPLRRGDVVKIIDAAYQEWWRGELRGRVGIFPVTYVEVIPEPTPDIMLAEAQYEAEVFSQAGEVDRLLHMLQSVDPERESVSDNDELSDLYQRCLMLRPKVLKLVEKYTAKKNELLDINNRFMAAKTDYEAMLDDSWRQHHAAQQQTQAQANYYATQEAYQSYPAQKSGAPPQRQSSYPGSQPYRHPEQLYRPPQPPAAVPAAPGAAAPQPFYDQASQQWFWPAQSVPDQGQPASPQQYQRTLAEQQPYQPGYSSPHAPPTSQFSSLSLHAGQPQPAQ